MPKTARTGTNSTEVESFNLVSIIEACAKNGVSKLTLGSVEICFKEETKPLTVSDTQGLSATASLSNPAHSVFSAEPDGEAKFKESSFPYDKELLESLRVSQLMIDDPHGFEHEVVNLHLRGDHSETV